MSVKHHAGLLATASAMALAMAAPALAQVTAPASASAQAGDDRIGEVIVTAQRTSASVQKTPLAVTALSGAQLEAYQLKGAADLKLFTPNLTIERNLSNVSTPKLYMRGIGVSNAAFSFDSPIGIYVDDVYYPRVVGSLIDFLDVDRIEVLRGPQGTIYGRNASIGAIRVISKAPPLEGTEGGVDVTYGSARQLDTRASFGAALVPGKLGVQLGVVTNNNEGFQTNSLYREKTQKDDMYALRGAVLMQVSDKSSLTIRADYLRDTSRPTVASRFLNDPDDNMRTYVSELSYKRGTAVSLVETWGISATGKTSVGGVDLTSITAFRGINQRATFDADGTTKSAFEVRRGDLDEKEFTQEIFASGQRLGALPVDWVAGAFYFHEPNRYVWSLQIFDPPTTQYFRQTEDSLSGYAQGTFHLGDRLSVTAGGRYTEDKKDFHAVGLTATGGPDFTYDLKNNTNDKFTWRAAANFQATPDLLVYASASTGFRSAALNGNAQSLGEVTGGAFGVESTLMYETGLKSTLWDGKATFNAAGFYGKYKNLQLAVTQSSGAVSTTNNDADVYGLELEAQVRPVHGLQLFASLGTLHSDIANSSKILTSPKIDLNLGGSYTADLPDGAQLALAAAFHHEGMQFDNVNNDPLTLTPAHDNLDASVTYTPPSGGLTFTVGGRNLTNDVYPVGGFNIANGFVAAVRFPSLPRRYYAKVAYRF